MTQAYELACSGPDAPQCCVCNHVAEHQCAACRELICADHARSCEFCEVKSQESREPRKLYCDIHVTKIEENFFVCEADMPAFFKEAAAVLVAARVEAEVMA